MSTDSYVGEFSLFIIFLLIIAYLLFMNFNIYLLMIFLIIFLLFIYSNSYRNRRIHNSSEGKYPHNIYDFNFTDPGDEVFSEYFNSLRFRSLYNDVLIFMIIISLVMCYKYTGKISIMFFAILFFILSFYIIFVAFYIIAFDILVIKRVSVLNSIYKFLTII